MKRDEFFKKIGLGAIGVILAPEAVKALEKEQVIEVKPIIKGADTVIGNAIINPHNTTDFIVLKGFRAYLESGCYYVGDNDGWKYPVPSGKKTEFKGCVSSNFLKHQYPKECHLTFYYRGVVLECDILIDSFTIIMDKNNIELNMSLSGALNIRQ